MDNVRESRRAAVFYDLDFQEMDTKFRRLGRHVFTGLYNWQRIEAQARYYDNVWTSNSSDLNTVLNGDLRAWSGTRRLASGEFDPENFRLQSTPSRVVEGSS